MLKATTARFTSVDDSGFEKLKEGVDKAAAIICSTLGPHGRNVYIGEKKMPLVTRDGATVARNLKFEDAWLRLGGDMLIDAALKTEAEGGDSTTTTCALVQGLLHNLPKEFNTREVCDELQKLSEQLDEMITDISIPVLVDGEVNLDLLKKVAIISANNNKELGTIIAELVAKVGLGGVIHVEPSETDKTYTDIKKGYNWKEGVITPHFLPKGSVPITIEHPLVLLIEQKITDQKILLPIYKAWQENFRDPSTGGYARSLVLIASDIGGSALDFMVTNYQKGVPAICIKAPGLGQERLEGMQDLKLITGAKQIFSEYTGTPISKFGKDVKQHFNRSQQREAADEFGQCAKIYVGLKETSVFFDETEELKEQIKDYCAALDEVDHEFEGRKQFYKERKSKLTNGIGYIYVGASSHTELHNKALTIDDAQLSCFSALEEGVLVGGCHTFLNLAEKIDHEMMQQALIHPFKILLTNSDLDADNFKVYSDKNKVFNVKTMSWEKVSETEVLDATKGIRNAVKNAISVSIEIIKSKYLVQWVDSK